MPLWGVSAIIFGQLAGAIAQPFCSAALRKSAYCELFGSPSIGETIECELAFKAAGSAFNSKRTATYDYAVEHKSEYIGTKSCAEEGAMHAMTSAFLSAVEPLSCSALTSC